MLVVLAVSIAWSMGIITLTVGHLTIFSVMFISIVVGIGIDYGIYFLFRYEEEIFLGRSLREALELTAARTGPGHAARRAHRGRHVLRPHAHGVPGHPGARASSRALAILLAWLGMMTLFPAVLMLVDRRHARAAARAAAARPRSSSGMHVPVLDRLTALSRSPCSSSPASATAASLWALPSVGFDYNLLNLQAKGTESVVWERRILATTGRSGFNGLASASTPRGAAARSRRPSRRCPRCPRSTPCCG